MPSLLTAAQIAQARSMIDDLHTTFARTITVINEVANAVIIDDPNYDAFSDTQSSNITYTSINTEISARVKWMDRADAETELVFPNGFGSSNGTSIPINQSYGIVRIKVDKQYQDLVEKATKFIIDGYDCQLTNASTPKSMISLNYTIYYLIRQK